MPHPVAVLLTEWRHPPAQRRLHLEVVAQLLGAGAAVHAVDVVRPGSPTAEGCRWGQWQLGAVAN
jgi:hypothetical protein